VDPPVNIDPCRSALTNLACMDAEFGIRSENVDDGGGRSSSSDMYPIQRRCSGTNRSNRSAAFSILHPPFSPLPRASAFSTRFIRSDRFFFDVFAFVVVLSFTGFASATCLPFMRDSYSDAGSETRVWDWTYVGVNGALELRTRRWFYGVVRLP